MAAPSKHVSRVQRFHSEQILYIQSGQSLLRIRLLRDGFGFEILDRRFRLPRRLQRRLTSRIGAAPFAQA
jgi:hypothetical protein